MKPWQLVLPLAGLAIGVWFVRHSSPGRPARALLVVSIALVVASVLAASLPLLLAGIAVFVASLAASYLLAARATRRAAPERPRPPRG